MHYMKHLSATLLALNGETKGMSYHQYSLALFGPYNPVILPQLDLPVKPVCQIIKPQLGFC